MTGFADSYLGQLRSIVGTRILLVPGARVILENADGEILLQQRSDFGVWGLPGGNAEIGENLETVARREVLEETGLVVLELVPFGFGCDPAIETHTFPNGDQCQFFVLNFCSRNFEGILKISDDREFGVKMVFESQLAKNVKEYANERRSLQTFFKHWNFPDDLIAHVPI